jgi:hypothetical protein
MREYSVTELLRCPQFRPWREVEEAAVRGREVHRMIQEWYRERYGSENVETEVEVDYTFKCCGREYRIVGHIDIVDFRDRKVIEIKPWTPDPNKRWMYTIQLSIYYFMALKRYRWEYGNPEWLFYRYQDKTLRINRVKPIIVRRDVEPLLKQLVLVREKLGDPPIRNGYCAMCSRVKTCRPVFKMSSSGWKALTLLFYGWPK